MVLTRLRPAALLALLLLLGACTSQGLSPTDPPSALPPQFQAWSDTQPAYRIGEGDKLRVIFPNTPEMDEQVMVRPDGVVTLRAAGEVAVADLTTQQAVARISEKAVARLRHPSVMVSVDDPASARVYIGGEVRTPGAYHLNGRMTVAAALQLASGTLETAHLDRIMLVRRGPDDRPMLRVVDLRAFLEGHATDNPAVMQGDILYVPRTTVAEFNLWMQEFIERAVPFQRAFTYTMGSSTTTLSP